MRRSVQPSRPNAMTWCFFASLKMLAIRRRDHSPGRRVNVLSAYILWPVFRCPSMAGFGCPPRYRITTEGAEWEWCLVLMSEPLPAGKQDSMWIFERTATVVAVTPLEGRALLARKRRFTDKGTRITLGNRLLDPWQAVLDANGV